MKRGEVKAARGFPTEALMSASDGTLTLWDKIELVTDMSVGEIEAAGHVLAEQTAETMSHIEKQDFVVRRALILPLDDGRWYVAAETNHEFCNWSTGEWRCFEESFPCADCGSVIQWADPMSAHADTCPLVVVHSVMTE